MEKIPTWLVVVAAALRGGDGRWLMHRRPFNKHHGGLWEYPGGKVEEGETPRQALIRELAEELGIEVSESDLHACGFAVEPDNAAGRRIVILLYTATDWSGEPRAVEGEAIGWFTADEIAALPRPPLDIELSAALCEKLAS